MMDNKNLGIAIAIGFGLLGLLFFLSRNPVTQIASSSQPLKLMPPGSLSRQYVNEEDWDIVYNDDGLPTHIKIKRDARET